MKRHWPWINERFTALSLPDAAFQQGVVSTTLQVPNVRFLERLLLFLELELLGQDVVFFLGCVSRGDEDLRFSG